MGDKEVRLNQSQRNENATPAAQSSATFKTNIRIEKRDYASAAALKPTKFSKSLGQKSGTKHVNRKGNSQAELPHKNS